MPVTAKLSRQFYDKFGDDIANELVDWFNQVDATYRNDLRELNELNFQRFDAKLEQRIAELRSEMQVGFANLERGMETRLGSMEARLGSVETRLEQRLGAQEQRLGAQMKWMFGFWLGTLLPLAGLMIALQRWGG